jgi:hypothetical protein
MFLITTIVFTSILSNTSTAQAATPWDVSRESYEYNYLQTRKVFDIDGTSGGDKTYIDEKTVEMWEINSTENEITFRTNNLELFLGCVHCESPECYQEYRDAWQYEETDDSLTVTYRYDKIEGELGFINPISGTFLCFTMEIPLNPVELPGYCFDLWGGMGFVFLPVLNYNFSFVTDFQSCENIYEEFNIQVYDTFTFSGKLFEGYSYEIEHSYIDNIGERKWENYVKYSYNTKGVLYNYYGEGDYYETIEGNLERSSHNELRYSIDSIDEDLIVGVSWPLSLLGFFIIITLWRKKNRKNRFSSSSEI